MLTDDIVDVSHVKDTLDKLSQLWRNRAIVNQGLHDASSIAFRPEQPDFAESLLPFRDHPRWREAPPALRDAALSYGWAIYNLKTVYVECDIVTPACEDLIKRPIGRDAAGFALQQAMSESLLDEALHTRMSVMACQYIYRHRGLRPLDHADFNLVSWRDRLLARCESPAQRRIARFAIATASETLITDYLKTLSGDTQIQPMCREVTRAHALDEWAHSSVFSVAAEHLIGELSSAERAFFASVIPLTVGMFADNELGAWAAALELLDFPHREEIIGDTGQLGKVSIYQESVANLLDKLGLETRSTWPD